MRNSLAQFLTALLLSVCVLCNLSCKKENPKSSLFSGERAFEEVKQIVAYSPRDAGTDGGHKAAAHIASRLEMLG